MNKQKIAIDMDDVLTVNGIRRLINEYLGTDYEDKDFTNFYMQDIVPDKEAFFKFFLTKNLYDYSDITEDAVEVIKELNEQYDVYITTSYIFKEVIEESGVFLGYKYSFLRKHFPFIDPYRLVFLGDKSILNVDIQIDDRLDNLHGSKTNILFNAYHNETLTEEDLKARNAVRCSSWKEIRNLLIK